MVRVLMTNDTAQLLLAIILQRSLAAQVRDCDHPAKPGFGAILPDRDQAIRSVEGAGHDLDAGAVDAAETQGRAAIPAKIALGDGGGAERGRLATGPGEIAFFEFGEGREGRARGLLAHPAMADADLAGWCRQGKADRAALAPTGQNGLCHRGHAVSAN